MPVQRTSARPYRDFLTPSLHRRFTNAALLTISICYLEACWMGEWDLFWKWFPLGLAGLRTVLLFTSALSVYVLRVAQLHLGRRTAVSGFEQAKSSLLSLKAFQTVGWYSISAWFFGEVYIWSLGSDALMGVVDEGRPDEPPKLNERPIYFRTVFLCLAIAQSILHLYSDYDRVQLPLSKSRGNTTEQAGTVQGIVPAMLKVQKALPDILQKALFRTVSISLLGPVVYMLFLRQTVWHYTFQTIRPFYKLPKESKPGILPPFMADLMGRVFLEAFLLLFLWEFCNRSFDIFVAQEPLKKDRLLTDDSKDPNGSLLAGLKSRKEVPRTMAFWELTLIANYYPTRRKSIFLDLERKGGSTFSQILTICLGELHAMVKRVQDFQNPTPKTEPPVATEVRTLPKLSQPLKNGDIFTATPPPRSSYDKLNAEIGAFAKSHGRNPRPELEVAPVMKLLTSGKESLLTKEHQEKLKGNSMVKTVRDYALDFLRTPVGQPFRVNFDRYVDSIVLSTPIGCLEAILDAIAAISQLAICSMKDDPYGKAYLDIPSIIRTFTSTATTLEGFLQTTPPHWSDIASRGSAGKQRRSQDVEAILSTLRTGLKNLLNEFGEYADDLGLTRAEIRKAKEVVAAGSKS